MKLFNHTFSPFYKRNKHPLFVRITGLWRIVTCRNFILIDFVEFEKSGEKGRKVRTLYRSDYDSESEYLTLKAAYYLKQENNDKEQGN